MSYITYYSHIPVTIVQEISNQTVVTLEEIGWNFPDRYNCPLLSQWEDCSPCIRLSWTNK